ncbi:MAG: hypothetical protein GF330_00395 [Candidatus Eisenbacteria bacterium]|nr:hypothetical protein [Candidatus Eisenbacteria bacterium]
MMLLLLVHGRLPFPGVGGGDLWGLQRGEWMWWPLLGYLLLGLSSAREAFQHHRRQRAVAIWILPPERRAA